MSNLVEKLRWAISNDGQVEKIVLSMVKYSRFLTLDYVACYVLLLLQRCAEMINFEIEPLDVLLPRVDALLPGRRYQQMTLLFPVSAITLYMHAITSLLGAMMTSTYSIKRTTCSQLLSMWLPVLTYHQLLKGYTSKISKYILSNVSDLCCLHSDLNMKFAWKLHANQSLTPYIGDSKAPFLIYDRAREKEKESLVTLACFWSQKMVVLYQKVALISFGTEEVQHDISWAASSLTWY